AGLGGSTTESTQNLGNGRFNCPAWAVQLSSLGSSAADSSLFSFVVHKVVGAPSVSEDGVGLVLDEVVG
ncbi:hypothetical protein BHM03_00036215, partial [Ensete ventricosum]